MTEPSHPFVKAFVARDLDGVLEQMSPQVVFRSPVISTAFRGKAELGRLFSSVFEVFEDVEFIEELDEGDRLIATFWLRFGRQHAKSIEFVRLDADGRVAEIEVFVRPMAGLTALAAALGPSLGRARVRSRGPLLRAASAPLAGATRRADPLVSKLVLGRSETLR